LLPGREVNVPGKGSTRGGMRVLVTQQSRLESRETMVVLTGMRRGTMWIKVCIVAFMVIVVTFALTSVTVAQEKDIPVNVRVKDNDGKVKTMKIKFDKDFKFKEAKVDGKEVPLDNTVTPVNQDNPLELGEHTKKITDIRGGSIIVFEGSTCIPIPDGQGGIRWLAYPPGTICP
jgi:hypothetical protein